MELFNLANSENRNDELKSCDQLIYEQKIMRRFISLALKQQRLLNRSPQLGGSGGAMCIEFVGKLHNSLSSRFMREA